MFSEIQYNNTMVDKNLTPDSTCQLLPVGTPLVYIYLCMQRPIMSFLYLSDNYILKQLKRCIENLNPVARQNRRPCRRIFRVSELV